MDSQTLSHLSSMDLKTRITERIQELAQATDVARVSEQMLCYLDMCARFHQYSPCNVWLILMANPNATNIAGFIKWKSFNRYVRKGEHGIPILAPIMTTITNENGEEEERLIGFKVVYVFDVSQTDGEPMPDVPDWKSPQKNAELMTRLTKYAKTKGIQIQVKPIGYDIQGVSLGGKIILAPDAGTKTLIHELAHEILHHEENAPADRTIRELEAESVAYVVAMHFGLDGLACPNYNALHGATAELILEHMERIRNTAAKMIQALEKEQEPVN